MHPDQSAESLAARLQGLPPPAVPEGLEARLLAAIPPERPAPRRRRAVRLALVGVAAACLLAVLVRTGADGKKSVPTAPRPPDDSAAWQQVRRGLEAEPPAFTWPLEETLPVRAPTAIPPDLLE